MIEYKATCVVAPKYTMRNFAQKLLISLTAAWLLLANAACVKKSMYRTEQQTRQLAEARERVILTELTDRKVEAAKMVTTIGELNKNLGKQESEIGELRSRIVQLSNSASKTTTGLLDEKNALEKTLKEKNALLAEKETELARRQATEAAQSDRLGVLANLLSTKLQAQEGVSVTIVEGRVVVSIPDKVLFETQGLQPSATGLAVLDSLARVLVDQPALPAQVVTYTDNQLPKGNKTLTDTWDWSLRRATVLVRALTSDFGVNANQLSPVGRGEFYPVATNETPEGRQQNRRTEVVFEPK
jgi:chemotaxis protein MotB